MKKYLIYLVCYIFITTLFSCNINGGENNNNDDRSNTPSAPLQIDSVSPNDNALSVSILPTITITFNQAVQNIINKISLHDVNVPNPAIAVDGWLNETNNIYTLIPKVALNPNTTYTINIESGIYNKANNESLSASTYTFTTKNPQWVYVGGSQNVQNQNNQAQGIFYNVALALNTDNIPYIAFRTNNAVNKTNESTNEILVMNQFNPTESYWDYTGGTNYIPNSNLKTALGESTYQYNNVNIAIGTDNVPYISFRNNTPTNNRPYVMYLNSTNAINPVWKSVEGTISNTADIFKPLSGAYNNISLALTESNIPCIAYIQTGDTSTNTNSTVRIAQSDASRTNWSLVGINPISESSQSAVSLATGTGDVKYIAYMKSGYGESTIIKKYDGIGTNPEWQQVANTITDNDSNFINIAIDQNNNPYISYYQGYKDKDGNYIPRIAVMKLNNTQSQWVPLGSNSSFLPDSQKVSMALDKSGSPYLAMILTGTTTVQVIKFDSITNTWITVGEFSNNPFTRIATPQIVIDSHNIPYLALQTQNTVSSTTTATVLKLDTN